jgi:hypothetical protein
MSIEIISFIAQLCSHEKDNVILGLYFHDPTMKKNFLVTDPDGNFVQFLESVRDGAK